ncbi:MAG: protein kinase domain-containing protein, partial [Planctomycetota bacterium]
MARLVVREGGNVGASCRLPADSGRATLGRRKGVGLQILDEKASRDHAEVVVEGGMFILRDLHSRNGTHLDGRKIIDDEILEPGASIRIGNTVIELEEDGGIPEGMEIHGLEILERLGAGRMGVVYKARQVSMDRAVAVKVLNEAREAASLSHLNVIRVFDAGVAGDLHYFTMEYIDGTTVSRLIRRKGRIPVDRALGIVRQVARALDHAHESGIIHRDVRPSGIMVAADDRVKVADLGISKAFDESSGETGLLGTPHYMSPEQASGGEVDVRTDVYSLGATLYHMLTGEVPFAFDGRDPRDVAKAHTTGSLRPVQDVESAIPDSVASMVERMMARDPEKRYPSMAALLGDLGKVIGDREAHVEAVAPGESSVRKPPEGSVRR